MAAEGVDVENSFHQIRDCTDHAQMQSGQAQISSFSSGINLSESWNVEFFSSHFGLSCRLTYTVNLKPENLTFLFLQANISMKKSPLNSSDIVSLNRFELYTPNCILVPNFVGGGGGEGGGYFLILRTKRSIIHFY